MPYFYGSLTSFNCVDVPIAADFTGDAISEVAVYRRGKKSSFVVNDPAGARVMLFGNATDEPVVGDWDGDGAVNLGIWRAKRTKFRLQTPTGVVKVRYGLASDRAIAGDWDGNGTDEVGVYRASEGTFYQRRPDGSSATVLLGDVDDLPVAGDWDGNGVTDLGVFDQATATFTLRLVDANAQVWTSQLPLGVAGDLPVAGDWDGDGDHRPRRVDAGHGDLHPGPGGLPDDDPAARSRPGHDRVPHRRSPPSSSACRAAEALTPAVRRAWPGRRGAASRPSGWSSENVCTPSSVRSAKATVPGRNTGFLKATSTVTASGRRFSIAAMLRAKVHMPCAICRGKPSALAVSG